MKKIFGITLIIFSICGFIYLRATLIPSIPKIDDKNWGIDYLRAIFPHIDVSEVYSFHSYVRNPPYLRRAVRDMIFVFEIPRKSLSSILDTTPKYKYSEVYELIEEKNLPQDWIGDINKKLVYIKKRSKKNTINFSSISEYARFFRERHKNPELNHGVIIIDSLIASQDTYLVIYAQAENY